MRRASRCASACSAGASIDIGLTDTAYSINNIAAFHPLKSHLLRNGQFHTLRLELHAGLASFAIDGVTDTTGIVPVFTGSTPGRILFGALAGSSRSLTEMKTACYSTTVASCDADLSLQFVPPVPKRVALGQTFTVDLREQNIGPVSSTGATLLISKTPGFKLVSPPSCVLRPTALACPIGGVAAGGQLQLALKATAVKLGSFNVTLTLVGQQRDGNAANNVKMGTVTVF